jgi:hypothetical protein
LMRQRIRDGDVPGSALHQSLSGSEGEVSALSFGTYRFQGTFER